MVFTVVFVTVQQGTIHSSAWKSCVGYRFLCNSSFTYYHSLNPTLPISVFSGVSKTAGFHWAYVGAWPWPACYCPWATAAPIPPSGWLLIVPDSTHEEFPAQPLLDVITATFDDRNLLCACKMLIFQTGQHTYWSSQKCLPVPVVEQFEVFFK